MAQQLKDNDFVIIQEQWLRESQSHRIKNIHLMVLSHDVSAIDGDVLVLVVVREEYLFCGKVLLNQG